MALKNLIYLREQVEIEQMSAKLQHYILENGKKFFEVWTTLVSDEIISMSHAFGERFFLEAACRAYEQNCVNKGAREILNKVIYLHMISLINEDIGWYIKNGLINSTAARDLDSKQDKAVKDLMPYLNDTVEALGCNRFDHLHGPIARDYVAFNAQTDFENFDAAGKRFDFVKGATQQSQYRARM